MKNLQHILMKLNTILMASLKWNWQGSDYSETSLEGDGFKMMSEELEIQSKNNEEYSGSSQKNLIVLCNVKYSFTVITCSYNFKGHWFSLFSRVVRFNVFCDQTSFYKNKSFLRTALQGSPRL